MAAAASAAGADGRARSRPSTFPKTGRGTLCVSTQVGCTLTCSFCHTGTQKLVRNLTAAEIVGQILVARDGLGEWPGARRPTGGPATGAPSPTSS